MRILSFGATDPGKRRANNEDAYLLLDGPCLYVVADGVGGNEGGEVASRIAVETIAEAVPAFLGEKDRTPPAGPRRDDDPALSALRQAVALANRKIREAQEHAPALADMATTTTTLLLKKGRAFLAHIGDSRAYLLRSGELLRLTQDHSFVEEQVRAGLLTLEQSRISPYRHVITRALGIDDDAAADFTEHEARREDTFLLCTDGLTEMVDDREIGRALGSSSPEDAVKKLVNAANDRGGVDNITVVVVKVAEI